MDGSGEEARPSETVRDTWEVVFKAEMEVVTFVIRVSRLQGCRCLSHLFIVSSPTRKRGDGANRVLIQTSGTASQGWIGCVSGSASG